MDLDQYSLDDLKSRIVDHSKFYYSDGFYIMETFGMKSCAVGKELLPGGGIHNFDYEIELGYSVKMHLINSFISNSEYLEKFLYLERRIDNIKKLGI